MSYNKIIRDDGSFIGTDKADIKCLSDKELHTNIAITRRMIYNSRIRIGEIRTTLAEMRANREMMNCCLNTILKLGEKLGLTLDNPNAYKIALPKTRSLIDPLDKKIRANKKFLKLLNRERIDRNKKKGYRK